MKNLSLVVFVGCFFFISKVSASPVMIYAKNSQPIALIGIEDPASEVGCENHLGFYAVDGIAYVGVSDLVGGIRVKSIANPMSAPRNGNTPFLITIDSSKMTEVDKSWLATLVKRAGKVLIAFNRCGSGGFDSARDIYKADALKW